MARIVIKKDDLKPNVVATLTDYSGTAVDLSTASSVRFIMKSPSSSTAKVDAVGVITSAASGLVGYAWSDGDTDTAGVYEGEFEVDWGSSVYQTFPAEDYIEIEVVADLGGSA